MNKNNNSLKFINSFSAKSNYSTIGAIVLHLLLYFRIWVCSISMIFTKVIFVKLKVTYTLHSTFNWDFWNYIAFLLLHYVPYDCSTSKHIYYVKIEFLGYLTTLLRYNIYKVPMKFQKFQKIQKIHKFFCLHLHQNHFAFSFNLIGVSV